MPLASDTRIGSYEIRGLLGTGGMGEVYRARDPQLNRDVAIKILPESMAHDAERVARFTREARTLAALNHPNIAQIYGIVETPAGGGRAGAPGGHLHALVMELVDGEDLSAAIGSRGLPLDDVLGIARQIADALEAAHENGVIHRDLKPANIKVKSNGTVKVLDFGLAKAMAPDTPAGDIADSPTITTPAGGAGTQFAQGTQAGTILGTAAYMAPEQARGKSIDRRADIWAFGAVLFEMLTGRRAFAGDNAADVLASILKSEPDWSALPAGTPASVRRLLSRCLEKDPRRRLSAIGDARLELDEHDIPDRPSAVPVGGAARRGRLSRARPALAAVLIVAAVVALIAWSLSRRGDIAGVTRLSVLPPPGTTLYPDSSGVAISPDGTMVAFLVGDIFHVNTELWVRSLDSLVARRLEGTDGATLPVWSPDSRRLAFFTTSGKLETIGVSGGRPEVLCDAPSGRGAVWTPSNVILFAPDAAGPLYRIAASGGAPAPLTRLDAARKEYGHRFPALLPDGRHFLYASLPGKNGQFDIFAGSLDDSSRTLVGSMEAAPVYADPGWLLSTRQGVLMAQRFDPQRLKITGEPVLLDDAPSTLLTPSVSWTAAPPTSISRTGSIAYFSAPSANTIAEWHDASGRRTGTLSIPAGHYESVAISPDGRFAVLVRSTSPSESTLWLVDLVQGSATPLSSGRGRNDAPVWSPDGTRIVFSADRDGAQDVFVKAVFDSSPEQPLFRSAALFKDPNAWSPDGKWIVMEELDPDTAQNVWLLPTPGGTALKPFATGPARERGGPVSPDGRWIAYRSDETGRTQLYLQSFPVPGRKVQVSRDGVYTAWWTRDGRRLLFLGGDLSTLWSADVAPGKELVVGTPKEVGAFPPNVVSADATPDRQHFLVLVPEHTGTGSITLVQNWLTAMGQPR